MASLLLGIGSVTNFIIPWIAKLIIDDSANMSKYIIILASIVVFSTVFSFIGNYLFNKIAITWTAKLRSIVTEHLLKVQLHYFNKNNSSEMSSKLLNYSKELQSLSLSNYRNAISILISTVSIVILFVLSWKLTLVLFGSLLVLVALLSPVSSISGHKGQK